MPEPRETHTAIDARRTSARGAPLVTRALARRLRIVRAERDALDATVQRVRALCDEAAAMNPEDYKTGQEHLTPAFREINYQDAFMALAKIINRIEAALAPSDPATDTGGEAT